MLTTLHVKHSLSRLGQPLLTVANLPGEGADMSPVEARRLAAALIEAASECEALRDHCRRYGAVCREYRPADDYASNGELRRVLPDLTVAFKGERWDLASSPARPGDLVVCAPTPEGEGLLIQSHHKERSGTWVAQAAPAHNPPHTAHTPRSAPRSGKPTTCASTRSATADHPQSMHAEPLQSTAQGNTPRHTKGKEPAAPAGPGNATP